MSKYKEKIMHGVFLCAALVSIAAVVLICLFLFVNGIPAMAKIGVFDFLLGTKWAPNNEPASYGIWPMILGSIYITVGAVILGVPIGIMTAIFLSRFCNKKIYKIIKPGIELLAGIPSVVYGFFGMIVLVPFVRNTFGGRGYGVLTASILLAIMILPTIVSVSESALNAVPNSYYEGALALGSTKEISVFKTVVPAAKSGILAGVVLAIGRAIGETMAVVIVAGNSPVVPDGILSGVRTLTINIVIEMGYATDLHREALIATGVVLFVLILIINLLFAIIKNKGAKS